MKSEVLYMKTEQHIQVTNKKIFLQDITKFYCSDSKIVDTLNKLVFMVIKKEENVEYSISILKIVEMAIKEYPGIEIVNLGETDFILEYIPPKKTKKALEYLKTAVVCGIAFFGAAFSIMTFNTDVSVSEVFEKIYFMVMGQPKNGGSILEISYSVGLALGIIIFYNHFFRAKIKKDPTPIEVEMRLYEEDVNKAIIKTSSREGKTIDAN